MFILRNIYQHLPKQFITQQNVGIHRPAPWVAYGYEKTLPGDWIAHFTALLLRLQQATSTVHGRPRNRDAAFERVKTPDVFCVSLGKPRKTMEF